MFFEYAIDPRALSNWERVRYFLDALGPWKGRFLARYPRRWKKMVYDGLDAAGCTTMEKKRIEIRLENLDKRVFSPRQDATYDPNIQWLDNALLEHSRKPFRAIIAERPNRAPAHVLDASGLDEASTLWRVDQGALLAREPSTIVNAITTLLESSSRVLLIDPYFRADQGDKLLALQHICAVVSERTIVEVHFGESVEFRQFVDDAKRTLPNVLGPCSKVILHCWRERPRGPRLHNRYIVTNTGGVQFGDSVERGQVGHADRISILEEASRAALWNEYAGTPPAFDRVGEPVEIFGKTVRMPFAARR